MTISNLMKMTALLSVVFCATRAMANAPVVVGSDDFTNANWSAGNAVAGVVPKGVHTNAGPQAMTYRLYTNSGSGTLSTTSIQNKHVSISNPTGNAAQLPSGQEPPLTNVLNIEANSTIWDLVIPYQWDWNSHPNTAITFNVVVGGTGGGGGSGSGTSLNWGNLAMGFIKQGDVTSTVGPTSGAAGVGWGSDASNYAVQLPNNVSNNSFATQTATVDWSKLGYHSGSPNGFQTISPAGNTPTNVGFNSQGNGGTGGQLPAYGPYAGSAAPTTIIDPQLHTLSLTFDPTKIGSGASLHSQLYGNNSLSPPAVQTQFTNQNPWVFKIDGVQFSPANSGTQWALPSPGNTTNWGGAQIFGGAAIGIENPTGNSHIFISSWSLTTQYIPEPSSFVLLGMAAVGLVGVGIRRRRNAA